MDCNKELEQTLGRNSTNRQKETDERTSADVTTLAFLVPEAESVWGSYRAQHDPSAAMGMPAHITVIWPFKHPDEIAADVMARIAAITATQPCFNVSFHQIAAFDKTALFLTPEPSWPFLQLTSAVWRAYPEFPPYGGIHAELIPHLTIGQFDDEQTFEQISTKVELTAKRALPLTALLTQLCLMEQIDGIWRRRHAFSLGRASEAQ